MLKRKTSFTLLILGASLFAYGSYLAANVAQGQTKLIQAEEHDQRRPTVGPVRRDARESNERSAQEQIMEKGQELASSFTTANWLRGTGIVLFALGMGGLLFCTSCRRR